MNVLVTGAFGNVGTSTVEALIAQGRIVRCFDLRTRANRRAARRFGDRIEVVWGDLRRPEEVAAAVRDQDVVVHLAFIIPKMSVTGVESEARPDWAREVNVGGTRHLLDAMNAQPKAPRMIFTSSCHVFGRTQHQRPPRTISDPVCSVEHYTRHKIVCERMVRASGLAWTILRLGVTLPLTMKLDPGMFDVPMDNRLEFVHARDVGLALANAVSSEDVWGKVLLIGGGPECQYYYRGVACRILDAMGVGVLPEEAFSSVPFCIDWMDTAESQRLLSYQQRDLEDYIRDMVALLGYRRFMIRLFRPVVRRWLLRKSPYLRRSKTKPPKGHLATRPI